MNFFKKISSEIKKLFLKKSILFLSSWGFAFFLFLPAAAFAQGWEKILTGAGEVVGSIAQVIAFLTLIFYISGLIVVFGGNLLNWVISDFISISYTKPCPAPYFNCPSNANPIIGIGLDITKSFVNLALVVALVYIALAIALKLGTKETSAKKLFIRLVLVALLVNFAPVVVGVIVDAANILMNYFLFAIKSGVIDTLTKISGYSESRYSLLSRALGSAFNLFSFNVPLIAQTVLLMVLNFATGFALVLLGALLIARYVIIWVLVILSPLAFVAWILPQTKKFWDMWWKNLIQWSFIGVPLAFFLYLGVRAYEYLPSFWRGTSITTAAIDPATGTLFTEVLPYFVVLIFVYIGFAVTLQTSALGAALIIGGVVAGGKWLGKKVGKGVTPWAEERWKIRERVGTAVRFAEKIPLARALVPEKVRLYAEFGEALSKAQEKAKHLSSVELGHRVDVGADFGKQATGDIMEMVERGDSEDFLRPSRKRYAKEIKQKQAEAEKEGKKISENEALSQVGAFRNKMRRLIQIGYQGGKGNGIVRGDPRLARFAVGIGPYEKVKDEHEAVQKATNEARSQHISHWEKEVTMDEEVMECGMERGRDFWQAVQSNVKAGHEEPLKTIAKIYNKLGAKDWDDFRKKFKNKKVDDKFVHEGKEGFFQYMEAASQRAKEQGWTPERVMQLAADKKKEEEEEKKKEAAKTIGEKLGVKEKGFSKSMPEKRKNY